MIHILHPGPGWNGMETCWVFIGDQGRLVGKIPPPLKVVGDWERKKERKIFKSNVNEAIDTFLHFQGFLSLNYKLKLTTLSTYYLDNL